ncbi:DUF5686 family protein [Aquimarina brevivitae]|uniref:Carboxypeptidase-like protein n=1 Tax=Aquimarina brevivitae TaxID=323412 RepID=A0A4Q7PFE5_9FLAO|nr:DUF5686 family protein [Aquimarina brevivitae]RZS98897.1 carboxypeptidase-like protein [Aquimarina brevivitae]
MRIFFLYLLLILPLGVVAQFNISGKVIDITTGEPLPFATLNTSEGSYALTSSEGTFFIRCKKLPLQIQFNYLGYHQNTITVQKKSKRTNLLIKLKPDHQQLSAVKIDFEGGIAANIIKEAIQRKAQNNPEKKLNSYRYKTYNTFKITEDNQARLTSAEDTTNVEMENLFNKAHSFFSEKISLHQYQKGKDRKETVLATRMTGFKKPVYDVLGINIQSTSLYNEDYIIFDNRYAGPLSNNATRNYYYKVLDTLQGQRPAYVILFQPRRSKKVASLEGVLYLDMQTLAIQKAVAEVRGKLNIVVTHDFQYYQEAQVWFPQSQKLTIKPGFGKQKVSLFGGQISVGSLQNRKKDNIKNNDFLISQTDIKEVELNADLTLKSIAPAISIAPEAINRPESYWQKYRTDTISKIDRNSFGVVDSIVKAQHIERRIDVIQSFNIGYYPVGFFNFDLTYPLKYNNYEGVRTGIGGITNKKFSELFRLESYLVYGFRDGKFKYGIGGGVLLNQNKSSWLNINYKDDLREVGSFAFLTDRRVYSLFEPRLVNIDFYYKHRTYSTSLQHRISPKLLTETQVSISDIEQTGGYQFLDDGEAFSSYKMAESSISLRWTPFSKYLKTPTGYKEVYDGYPKITAQYTQGFKGFLESNFNYSKIAVKAEYAIQRLNLSRTSFLFEMDIASGNIPLTHLFHAYPNAPTKETVLQRFSVAGRRSFETMYFGEFFSDKLATLQIRHRLPPFRVSESIKPELVLINRYAIGDVRNQQNHQGVSFNSLQHGYQESGFEINKIIAGFGLSFAYRYGAYHLPSFADNLSFKFTFYLKL